MSSAATAESTVSALLEASDYAESRTFDGLNRIKTATTPDGSVYLPTYNIAGLLEAVNVEIHGGSATNFVKNIDYDAKGQRTLIEYSDISGARFKTEHTFDPFTLRLTRLVTTRTSPSNVLQDLSYTFDAVGNIVRISDDADHEPLFEVDPNNRVATYTYDPIYRLIAATGREHQSIGGAQVNDLDLSAENLPDPNDPTAVRQYEETYQYDVVGNIEVFFHDAGSGAQTWTRNYSYGIGKPNNRLASNSFGAGTASYTHDVHGNMTVMPRLAAITYTPFDQMQNADLGGGGDAYYVYDSSGTRVRKVIVETSAITIERIYLGSYEIYRKHVSGALDFERQTLHVSDDASRIAIVETKTWETGAAVTPLAPMLRFQLGNHLGSAVLELDEDGLIISYEEYHPYGTSAYQAARSGVDVSARRYRYTGKERDDETGLYYNGARYLAAWLGRWTSADPIGMQAGLNLYQYCRGSPINYVDPSGTQEHPPPAPPGYTKDRDVAIEHAPNERGEIVVESQHFVDVEKALSSPALNVVPPASTEPLDDPEHIRRLQGIGVIERGDVKGFFQGMWNGTGGWLTDKTFSIHPEHEGSAIFGEHFGQSLALEGAGKAVFWGIGKVGGVVRGFVGIGDDLVGGVEDAIKVDKGFGAWSKGAEVAEDAVAVKKVTEAGAGVARVEKAAGAAARGVQGVAAGPGGKMLGQGLKVVQNAPAGSRAKVVEELISHVEAHSTDVWSAARLPGTGGGRVWMGETHTLVVDVAGNVFKGPSSGIKPGLIDGELGIVDWSGLKHLF